MREAAALCRPSVRSLRSKWPVTFRTGIVRQTRDVSAPSGLHYLMYQRILHFWKIEATNKCLTYILKLYFVLTELELRVESAIGKAIRLRSFLLVAVAIAAFGKHGPLLIFSSA